MFRSFLVGCGKGDARMGIPTNHGSRVCVCGLTLLRPLGEFSFSLVSWCCNPSVFLDRNKLIFEKEVLNKPADEAFRMILSLQPPYSNSEWLGVSILDTALIGRSWDSRGTFDVLDDISSSFLCCLGGVAVAVGGRVSVCWFWRVTAAV